MISNLGIFSRVILDLRRNFYITYFVLNIYSAKFIELGSSMQIYFEIFKLLEIDRKELCICSRRYVEDLKERGEILGWIGGSRDSLWPAIRYRRAAEI